MQCTVALVFKGSSNLTRKEVAPISLSKVLLSRKLMRDGQQLITVLTSGISSGTFPIHDNDSIVQSHFVLMFRSKCKCILWPKSAGQLTRSSSSGFSGVAIAAQRRFKPQTCC